MGWGQDDLSREAGRRREAANGWLTGRTSPPRKVLTALAVKHGWPVAIFEEDGPRPAEAIRAPLTDPGLSARQVAELLAGYRPSGPLTADVEGVKRAIVGLEEVLRVLKASLSEGPKANADLVEFVKTAEAGHPTQPPPAARQGKSG